MLRRKNKDGEPLRFHPMCMVWLHRWTNSKDKNNWACWRCSRCNNIAHILGSAPH